MYSILSSLLTVSIFSATVLTQSTTVCSLTGCNQDNCYRNIQKSTAFCASFTGGTPISTTQGLNPSQASCGPTRLSSACSCLYPPGATTVSARGSITTCTVVPLAPSPTVFNYDFSNPTDPPVSVYLNHDLQSVGVVSDASNARSPPNLLKASFFQEKPGTTDARNVDYYVTGAWRPNTNYTFSLWAKQDASDNSFKDTEIEVTGLKQGPLNDPQHPSETPAVISNHLVDPRTITSTYQKLSLSFNSHEYLYYAIFFYFNNADISQSGVISSLYLDDISLVQT